MRPVRTEGWHGISGAVDSLDEGGADERGVLAVLVVPDEYE